MDLEEQTKSRLLASNTMQRYLGMWSDNFRENWWEIITAGSLFTLPKIDGPALCVGAGPSLRAQLLRVRRFDGTVFACEKTLLPLLRRGVIPDYLVALDGSDLLVKHLSDPLIDEYADRITAVCSTTVSPTIVKRWRGEKVFFTPWLDDPEEGKSVTKIFHRLARCPVLQTGGHVGAAMWFLARYLEADPIVLLGIDLAYPGTLKDLSQTQIWPAVMHLDPGDILQFYCRVTNPFGREVIVDYMWDGLREAWASWIASSRGETIQCSDHTSLFAPPLRCMTFEEYLNDVQTKPLSPGSSET